VTVQFSSHLNLPELKIQNITNLQFDHFARYQNSPTTQIFMESTFLIFFVMTNNQSKF